jgi:hypothetical protein
MVVNIPKSRNTYCKGKNCRKHTLHKVTQYKTGKASVFAQVRIPTSFVAGTNDRVNDDTTESNLDTEVRLNPSSTRRYSPPLSPRRV